MFRLEVADRTCPNRNLAREREDAPVLSALMMLRRVVPAFRYAIKEEEFLQIFGAGLLLVVVGTVTYTLGQDWHVVDAFYFSVSTLSWRLLISRPQLAIGPSFGCKPKNTSS